MATEQEGDDDIPVLSEYALAALQEFYQEQGTKQECVNTVQEDWVIIISNNNNNNRPRNSIRGLDTRVI